MHFAWKINLLHFLVRDMDMIFIHQKTYYCMPAAFASACLSPLEKNSSHIHTTNWTLVALFHKYNLNLLLNKKQIYQNILDPKCAA